MDKKIIIQIEPTPEIVNLLEALIKSSGVKIANKANPMDEYLTIKEAANEIKVNYHTLRDWVVIKKFIPFTRLGDNPKGDIRILRRHLREFVAAGYQKKPYRGRQVTVI
ncbi:MAG: hypothetical protein VR65_10725 [Desulfobulbaceae bacterium BRH_c16a]|nr:MAG: hypothetical protein VR65_10725 [Desulfobulbaceae bacterium BRH_c16a]